MENEIVQNTQDQVKDVQMENQDLVKKTKSKNNKWLIIILLIVSFVSVSVAGFFGYKYFQVKDINDSSESASLEEEVKEDVNSTSNLMESWKTYGNSSLGFKIKYPPSVKVERELNDDYNRSTYFKGDGLSFEIMLREKWDGFELESYYYMDSPITEETFFKNRPANIYEMPNGYCDGPGCSEPSTTEVFTTGSDIFHLIFYGDTVMSEIENKILDSFEFMGDKTKIVEDDDPREVANAYLTAYVNKDWLEAKKFCPSLEEEIAEGYGFTKFEIISSIPDRDGRYYVYVKFTDEKGNVFDKAPHSDDPLKILMSRDEKGVWKVLTWYFYE